MFTVHVISDLNLQFNEFTPESEKNIPDVDLVILNGNISNFLKRGMLYAEELCRKYPTTQFVYNLGFTELYHAMDKNVNEMISALQTRSNINETWPKNLHCFPQSFKQINLRSGHKADVFCAFGYPKILSYIGNWEDHIWYKNVVADITRDINDPRITLPKETSKVCHGDIPIWATREWLEMKNDEEFKKIKKWELDYDANSGYKILVTHINPVKDSRCDNQTVSFFNIHLDKRLWISSNTKINNIIYLGAKFVSNPGRGAEARSSIITAN